MRYGPQEAARDLTRIRDGTASFEDRARLEHGLLRRLQEYGNKGVANLLREMDDHEFARSDSSDSSTKVIYTSPSSDRPRLVVTTYVGLHSASVNVTLDADSSPESEPDPRHEAFYAIWEAVLETAPSQLDDLDPEQRAVFLIGLLEAEVMNGGLGQYLANTEGAYLQDTVSYLQSVGAEKTRDIVVRAVELGATSESYAAAWDDKAEEYSQLDTEFLDSGEDLAALTADKFLGGEPAKGSV